MGLTINVLPPTFVLSDKLLVDNCIGPENLRLERGTNHHTGQPLWRVVCASVPPEPDHLQLFEQHLEPVHEGVAGDAWDQVTSQAEYFVQEETTQVPPSGQQDAGRRTSSGEEHSISTQVHDEQQLPQPSPASPATVQRAEEEASSAFVVQASAVSPEEQDGQRRHGEATGQRCRVQRCEEVPFDSGWCAAHHERAEILRVGACLDYPVLNYASEHATQQGEAAWMQFLQYPQCHRLAERLLGYLKEQYPYHFPQRTDRSC